MSDADTLALEDAHQVIFCRHIELGITRITLTSATPAELIVDTIRLMSLRAYHNESAKLANTSSKLDVSAASSDVGRKGNAPF